MDLVSTQNWGQHRILLTGEIALPQWQFGSRWAVLAVLEWLNAPFEARLALADKLQMVEQQKWLLETKRKKTAPWTTR